MWHWSPIALLMGAILLSAQPVASVSPRTAAAPAAAAQGRALWYVATDGDDDHPGSAEQPFASIQRGIQAATPGDVVLIADGVYRGEGNREIDFLGKDITVRSASRRSITPATKANRPKPRRRSARDPRRAPKSGRTAPLTGPAGA